MARTATPATKKATTKTAAKKAATKTAAKKAVKKVTKTASAKKPAPAKTATKKATVAKKAATKKTAAKKTTERVIPIEVKATKASTQAKGSVERLTDNAGDFVAQVGRTASTLAHEAGETATTLGRAAYAKAEASVQRGRDYIANNPGKVATLTTTGVALAGALLGRNKLKGVAKVAAAAVVASQTQTLKKKAGSLLKSAGKKLGG